MQLEIHIPRNAKLDLGTVTGGVIEAENVTGDLVLGNVNGDLDTSFPERFSAELHIVTRQDEIISDFEVEVVPTSPKGSRREKNNRYEVELGQEIVAPINGG